MLKGDFEVRFDSEFAASNKTNLNRLLLTPQPPLLVNSGKA